MTNRQYAPISPYTTNEWSSFYFDVWATPELACCASCCPCYVFGKNAQKIRKLDSCYGPCLTYTALRYLLPCYLPCYSGDLRKEIREKFNISGNSLRDCCVHCLNGFSCSAALVQEARELELRGYGNWMDYNPNQGPPANVQMMVMPPNQMMPPGQMGGMMPMNNH